MKSFVVKYIDEDGAYYYHSFDEGFSFDIGPGDLTFDICFYDPTTKGNKPAISAEVYVEPANPYTHMALMTEADDFMICSLDEVAEKVSNAIDEHIINERKIFDLTALTQELYEDLDEIAEKYIENHCKGLPEKLQEECLKKAKEAEDNPFNEQDTDNDHK